MVKTAKTWRRGNEFIVGAIDPGISGSGLAVFDWQGDDPRLVHAEVFTPGTLARESEWDFRAQIVGDQVVYRCREFDCGKILIEQPAFFETHKGSTSARSGSLVKLTFFVGYIYGRLRRRNPELVPVTTWKGQLSKDAVKKRINRKLVGKERDIEVSSHAWDAVGIGLHHYGRF